MIIDHDLTMSNHQALVASTYSTDTVDLGQSYPLGSDLLSLYVCVIAESGTSPTLAVELETSSDNSTFTLAAKVIKPAGKKAFGIPLSGVKLAKYNRLHYTLGGTSPEYTVTASFVSGVQSNDAYPDSPRLA